MWLKLYRRLGALLIQSDVITGWICTNVPLMFRGCCHSYRWRSMTSLSVNSALMMSWFWLRMASGMCCPMRKWRKPSLVSLETVTLMTNTGRLICDVWSRDCLLSHVTFIYIEQRNWDYQTQLYVNEKWTWSQRCEKIFFISFKSTSNVFILLYIFQYTLCSNININALVLLILF